jgi:hypothetical protein
MRSDPAAAVRALRACRDAMIQLSMNQHGLAIIAVIDGLAAEISGESGYFVEPAGGATEGQRKALDDKMARERGELPWKP